MRIEKGAVRARCQGVPAMKHLIARPLTIGEARCVRELAEADVPNLLLALERAEQAAEGGKRPPDRDHRTDALERIMEMFRRDMLWIPPAVPAHPEPAAPSDFQVQMICSAYESGVGKGHQGRTYSNPYPEDAPGHRAYELGTEKGREMIVGAGGVLRRRWDALEALYDAVGRWDRAGGDTAAEESRLLHNAWVKCFYALQEKGEV